MFKYLHFIVVPLCVILFSCSNLENNIPDYRVDIDVNTTACGLDGIPSYKIFDKQTHGVAGVRYTGYCGVIVVHAFDAKYYAFELSCPNNDCVGTSLKIFDNSLLTFICPKCGEIYDLSTKYGLPTKGISKYALTPYSVSSHGITNIFVSN